MAHNSPTDHRSKAQTEADEIEAIKESQDVATAPVSEAISRIVEPASSLEAQGDIPGLDDNSRLDHAPDLQTARDIAEDLPVGAGGAREHAGKHQHEHAAAFRDRDPAGPQDADVQVRPAGSESTRTETSDWDAVDEEVDESFPASDPPANY